MRSPVPPLLLLSACYSPEKFQQDEAAALCRLYEKCDVLYDVGAESYRDCVQQLESASWACDDFNGGAAQDCVDRLERLSCEKLLDGTTPSACDDACASTVRVDE